MPNAREVAGLVRYEKLKEEKQRWQYYRTIPLRHWREMSGRQAKVLIEQADLHGIPFSGKTIDLSAVVAALHNFLADNKYKLAGGDDDDRLYDGPNTPALEELRKIKVLRETLFYERDLGQWIRREDLHEGLAAFAGVLRRAGETLQRHHGADAHAVLDEALTDAIGALTRRFGEAEPTAEAENVETSKRRNENTEEDAER